MGKITELLEKLGEPQSEEELRAFDLPQIARPGANEPGGPVITNKMVELIGELQGELMLVEPTLNFVRKKKAEIAAAKLSVLFTPEELAAKRAELARLEGREAEEVEEEAVEEAKP